MEPLVVFCAGLVIYYAYRALLDALRDLQRERIIRLPKTSLRRTVSVVPMRTIRMIKQQNELLTAARERRPEKWAVLSVR
jgi:hypothetical protein